MMEHKTSNEGVHSKVIRIETPITHEVGVRASREWLGLKELTRYADISQRTLRSWIYAAVDPLPAAKVCGKVLVRRSDFDEFLRRHRVRRLNEIDLAAIVENAVKGVHHGR